MPNHKTLHRDSGDVVASVAVSVALIVGIGHFALGAPWWATWCFLLVDRGIQTGRKA